MSDIETFSYTSLEADLAQDAKSIAKRIRKRLHRAASDIVAIGVDLMVIKEKLPHGQFTPWLRSEFDMSLSTAQRFMRVARMLEDKNVTVTLLSPKALYELAAPSTDEQLRQDILKRAEQGEEISSRQIQILKQERAKALPPIYNRQRAQSELNELDQALSHLTEAPEQASMVASIQKKRDALAAMLKQEQINARPQGQVKQVKTLVQEVRQLETQLTSPAGLKRIHQEEMREALEELNQSCQSLIQEIVDLLNNNQ